MESPTSDEDTVHETNRKIHVLKILPKDLAVELRRKVYHDTRRVYDKAKLKFTSSNFFKLFFVLSILLALSEPVLVAYGTTGIIFDAQIGVLGFSTILYFVGSYFTYSYINSGTFYEKIELLFSREAIGEGVCLFIGWVFIFTVPAVAALRCFRVFRLLWYLSQDPKTKSPEYRPEEHWVSIRQTCNLCTSYLQRLGEELFSAKSRGGFVVIAILMYTTYIFSVIFSGYHGDLETHEGKTCKDLQSCFITLLRLSFYDVAGFNYLESVVFHGNGGLAFLLLGYLIFTAMMLLNGLIGIFGHAFELSAYVQHKADLHRHQRNVIHNAFKLKDDNKNNKNQRISDIEPGIMAVRTSQQGDHTSIEIQTHQPFSTRVESNEDLTSLNSVEASLFSNKSSQKGFVYTESPMKTSEKNSSFYNSTQENTDPLKGLGTGAALDEYLHQLSTQLVYLNKSVVTQMKLIELVSHKIEAIETRIHKQSRK